MTAVLPSAFSQNAAAMDATSSGYDVVLHAGGFRRTKLDGKLMRYRNKSLHNQCSKKGKRVAVVAESYRKGGGPGDFVAGFLLGGAVFGALGFLLAPQRSVNNGALKPKLDDTSRKILSEEEIELTRKSLAEKITQLNESLDNVSDQMSKEAA